MVDELADSKRLTESEKSAYCAQLDALSAKMSTVSHEKNEGWFEMLENLDSLAQKASAAGNADVVKANLLVVDTLNGDKEFFSDAQENNIDIRLLSLEQLRPILEKRQKALNENIENSRTCASDLVLRSEKELLLIGKLIKRLPEEKSLPVALENDLLGTRILGVVQSYECRHIGEVAEVTPVASVRSMVGRLSDERRMIENRMKRELSSGNVSKVEAANFQESLRSIDHMENQLQTDGKLSDGEWSKVYSALCKLHSRLSRSLAAR